MKATVVKFAALSAMTISCIAEAQIRSDGLYLGGTFGYTDYPSSRNSSNPLAAGFLAGWSLTPNFALEGRFGANTESDSAGYLRTPITIDAYYQLNDYSSLYVRGLLPVSNRFSLVGMVGFTNAKLKQATQFNSSSSTSNGISGGVGGEYFLGRQSSLSLEWVRLIDNGDYRIDAFAAAYRYKFLY